MKTHSKTTFLIMALGLIALMLACLCLGKYRISVPDILSLIWNEITGNVSEDAGVAHSVLFGLRLPRVLASVLVGAALSVSGAAYQGIFRNPLVSPDILGVSSGACVGAALAILFTLGSGFVQGLAFVFGIAAVLLSASIPRLLRSDSSIMLVLSGIIVGGLMNSILGFIKYVADPETQLAPIVYWMMGDFSGVSLSSLGYTAPALILPAIVLFVISWWVDILSLGDSEAKSLGVNVGRLRGLIIIMATLLTASAICVAGAISWVGLVVPHFGRMLIGSANTRLLPAAYLLGGIFMLLVDTLTRVIGPFEMPISILTGLVGAPFYAWLLYRSRRTLA